jgi:dTDP-4-dehydrorhamnose 3,5-epimerase
MNSMPTIGTKDPQTVAADGSKALPPKIAGVEVHELGNVMTRSGFMTEVFRRDWPWIGFAVGQVNWAQMNPGAVTDWHMHTQQTDHLVGVNGNIKLALWDGRDASPTKGASEVVRIGAIRPVMVIVPPGVWHGLRNESGQPAGYLNFTDKLYVHADPDNWRLGAQAADVPNIL